MATTIVPFLCYSYLCKGIQYNTLVDGLPLKNDSYMYRQTIFTFIVAIFTFTGLSAQEVIPQRTTPAKDIHQMRQGEALDFHKVLRRLETAVKEKDFKSANELHADLVVAMEKRISVLGAEKSNDSKHLDEMKQQKGILKSAEGFQFSGKSEHHENAMEQVRQLQKFANLMDQNFITN